MLIFQPCTPASLAANTRVPSSLSASALAVPVSPASASPATRPAVASEKIRRSPGAASATTSTCPSRLAAALPGGPLRSSAKRSGGASASNKFHTRTCAAASSAINLSPRPVIASNSTAAAPSRAVAVARAKSHTITVPSSCPHAKLRPCGSAAVTRTAPPRSTTWLKVVASSARTERSAAVLLRPSCAVTHCKPSAAVRNAVSGEVFASAIAASASCRDESSQLRRSCASWAARNCLTTARLKPAACASGPPASTLLAVQPPANNASPNAAATPSRRLPCRCPTCWLRATSARSFAPAAGVTRCPALTHVTASSSASPRSSCDASARSENARARGTTIIATRAASKPGGGSTSDSGSTGTTDAATGPAIGATIGATTGVATGPTAGTGTACTGRGTAGAATAAAARGAAAAGGVAATTARGAVRTVEGGTRGPAAAPASDCKILMRKPTMRMTSSGASTCDPATFLPLTYVPLRDPPSSSTTSLPTLRRRKCRLEIPCACKRTSLASALPTLMCARSKLSRYGCWSSGVMYRRIIGDTAPVSLGSPNRRPYQAPHRLTTAHTLVVHTTDRPPEDPRPPQLRWPLHAPDQPARVKNKQGHRSPARRSRGQAIAGRRSTPS